MKNLLGLAAAIAMMTAVGCDSISIIGGEVEGTVKTDDCRAQIMVTEGLGEALGKKFMCAYQKSKSGKIMGGVCQAVELDGKACKAVYTYVKKPWTTCPERSTLHDDDQCYSCPEHSTPHSDDRCYPDPGYHWNEGAKQMEADPKPDSGYKPGGSLDDAPRWYDNNQPTGDTAPKPPEYDPTMPRIDKPTPFGGLSSPVQ